ncbi:MAG: ribonucleotide-diphosphate reductase subunit beta [Thaumarchaeota archaeon]|nr:ribonucleotide-diphosphate reductase subunit beta [Nitrososphaerota archaeon]
MYNIILIEYGIAVYKNNMIRFFSFVNTIEEYQSIKNYNKTKTIEELVKFIGSESCLVNDFALLNLLQAYSINVKMMTDNEINKFMITKKDILIDAKIAKNSEDAISKLRDFALQLSSSKIIETSQNDDLHVIQAVNSLDELDRIINFIGSRLKEWYGLHFPELENIIDTITGYAKLVMRTKNRKFISTEICKESGFPEEKCVEIINAASKSNGGDITHDRMNFIHTLSNFIIQMNETRNELESYLEKQMSKIAPNISSILGSILGARMIAHVGSLRKLACMSSSTIQIIGAEKALFRSIKTGSKPPKHGLLFQHSLIHSADRSKRGKIARTIASNTAIASRIDNFGLGLNKKILEKLNHKITEINTINSVYETNKYRIINDKPKFTKRNRNDKPKFTKRNRNDKPKFTKRNRNDKPKFTKRNRNDKK